ncbi:MAG: transcription termination/antitermination protein NusA [Erysipelothrix sp.]|nr:transcription termination/antitermination protein NusA [Erysipelothrix sp.]
MKLDDVVNAFNQFESERNLTREFVAEALEESLVKAYRREIQVPDAMVDIEIDQDSGNIRLFHKFEVVETVNDDELEVALDEIDAKDLKVGDFYRVEKQVNELGRAAVTLAKNVIKQKIREAEKLQVYNEYYRLMDEMITAQVETVEEKYLVLDLGKALAIMPRAAQMPNEYYTEGQNIKVVVTEVNKESRGAQILVSRATDMLVRRLFEVEVPEFKDNLVEIKAMAREAGDRTKVAVHSNDPDIDPIGAFIGHQGSRILAIKNELSGENIDIFEWSDHMIDLVKNSLSPAEVLAVFENPKDKGLIVIVEDDQLSLAIGKRGKNARLAVRLTKERIDIKSVTEANEMGLDYVALMAEYEAKLRAEQAEKEAKKHIVEVEADLDADTVVETEEHEVEPEVIDETLDASDIETPEVTEVVAEEPEEVIDEVIEEVVEEVVETPRRKRPLLKPRNEEFVSKFEDIADASRKADVPSYRRPKRRFDREEEEIPTTAEMLEKLDYEIVPEYTEEQLEEIEVITEKLDSEWYDEEIDFDAYDKYYDED